MSGRLRGSRARQHEDDGRDVAYLRLTVSDRGGVCGPWTPGIGIASMRERVEQVGGTLDVRADGDGATVTAEIPLPTHGG